MQDWRPIARQEQPHRILAVAEPGAFEERLIRSARTLGNQVSFSRTFDDGLARFREQFFDIVLLAKINNEMPARDFVRELKKINAETVVVIAAPRHEYERLIDVMLEGAYDFLPEDSGESQLKLLLGRAMDYARLRRRTEELDRALNIQNISLSRRLNELELLNAISRALASETDLDQLLGRALDHIIEAFAAARASFMILDSETNELIVRAAAGADAEKIIGSHRKIGEGVAGKVAQSQNPVLATDIKNDQRFMNDSLARQSNATFLNGSFIAVPLIHRGRLLGEMNITDKKDCRPFTPDDLRLATIVAGHIAGAIDGAMTADKLRKENDSLRSENNVLRLGAKAGHI